MKLPDKYLCLKECPLVEGSKNGVLKCGELKGHEGWHRVHGESDKQSWHVRWEKKWSWK